MTTIAGARILSTGAGRVPAMVIAALSLATARADDAAVPSPAASASKAVPAGIYLKGSCMPSYPEAARRAHVAGVTQVRFTIEPTGDISGAEVIHSAGPRPAHKLLDQAVLDALPKCPIRVGRDENGQPVGAQIVASYAWE